MSSVALVMIPPMLCDARAFAPQLASLSRRHAVMVAPNACGERMEEIASQILMSAPQRFALAGAGFGGMVALEIVRRASERVTKVALIHTNAQADTPEMSAAREPQIIAARAGRWDDVLAQEIDVSRLGETSQRAQVLAQLKEMAKDAGAETFVRQARALQRRRDQQPTIRATRQPALVICGGSDPQSPVKRHAFLAELLPSAQLSVIEDAGFVPMLEAAGEVTAALESWLVA